MTCADPFVQASPTYRAAVRTANRDHPAFTVGNPRPLGWEDLKTIRFRWPLAGAALVPVAGWLILTFGPGGLW